ncbi:MAG: type II toxin-antitoxin system VapC family toxin [Xenococcaceae cyanobacterium]
MSLIILDTDHVSLLQRDKSLVVQRFNEVNPDEVAITVITVEEQMRGRLNLIRRASSANEQISAYTKLRKTIEALRKFNLIDFNQAAYEHFAELRRQKIRIGTQDLRIAAIVLSVNGILVTRNLRDFGLVPNLMIEDWTIT